MSEKLKLQERFYSGLKSLIEDNFNNTNQSIDGFIEKFTIQDLGISVEDIEGIISELNLECCSDCGHWLEVGEFVDEENESHDNCRSCGH